MVADLDIENASNFYDPPYCDHVLQELLRYNYQDLSLVIKGKTYSPRRKVLAFSDSGLSYTFSGTSIFGSPWTPTLLDIKSDVEKKTGQDYNFVLLNYYPDGYAKIGAHRDNEVDLDPSSVIPTLSLGTRRTMKFMRKGFPPHQEMLENGSLLLMRPPTNQFWTHEIEADAAIDLPRISLTFRKIIKTSRKRTFDESFSSQGATASKRIVPDDSIPDKDWLTEMYVDETPRPDKSVCLKEWNFGYGFVVSIRQLDTRLFVHMRQYYTSTAATKGIVMNTSTFQEFCKKIFQVDLKYVSSSSICNNQLAIFCNKGELVFAQIYHFEEFQLKQGSLKVDYNNLIKIREIVDEMTDFIKLTLLNTVLPAKILQYCEKKQTHSFDLLSELLYALRKEVKNNVYELFHCDGCVIEDPSQFNHDCMMKPYEDMRFYVGDDALLTLNVKNVIENLQVCYSFIAKNSLKMYHMKS